MNTRRKFLVQGSLATTAVLALKPFDAIAKITAPLTGLGNHYGKLVFLHTADFHPSQQLAQYIASVKNKNAILLKAGQDTSEEASKTAYDVSIGDKDYTIINKGGIRTGIISAKPGDSNIIEKVNILAAYLKKEKNCSVVVCLSLLGYKNKNAADDMTLASKSTHLDVIIGGHTKNFPKHPMIALNSSNAEVIIHSAAGDPADLGKIELEFNDNGEKRQISFSNRSTAA